MTVIPVFMRCVEAIRQGYLIEREGKKDKEFHFQNWFIKRLEETGFNYDQGGRNSYPDFTMVKFTEGYELKGLAYLDAMQASTQIAKFLRAFTTDGTFTTSLGVTPKSLTVTLFQCSISSFAMGPS